MDQFLFTTGIFRHLQRKCTNGNLDTPKIFSDLFTQREINPYNRRHSESRVLWPGLCVMEVELSYIWVQKYVIFSRHHLRKQFRPCRLCKNYIPGVGFVESLP